MCVYPRRALSSLCSWDRLKNRHAKRLVLYLFIYFLTLLIWRKVHQSSNLFSVRHYKLIQSQCQWCLFYTKAVKRRGSQTITSIILIAWPKQTAGCFEAFLHPSLSLLFFLLSMRILSVSFPASCVWAFLTCCSTSSVLGWYDRARGLWFPCYCCETPFRWWNCGAAVSASHGGMLVSLRLSARQRQILTDERPCKCVFLAWAHTSSHREAIVTVICLWMYLCSLSFIQNNKPIPFIFTALQT